MFEEIFERKRPNEAKLEQFGFVGDGQRRVYRREIMDHLFTLYVTMGEGCTPDVKLIENETDEEYVLYKTDAQGTFVGDVRGAVDGVLREIAEACFETEIFRARQTQELIAYVRATYGDELEFLWKKFPDNAIWRRKDNEKWYGAILTVSRGKLGLPSDETAEILDLRMRPEDIGAVVDGKRYFPGWHMNKKSWITVILDGSVDFEEICRRLDDSYRLANPSAARRKSIDIQCETGTPKGM